MRVLITLGPTQEPIDDVRFITNASSGRMGAALAEEGLRRGHKVTIVAGPVNIKLPRKAKVVNVRTAREMTDKTLRLLKTEDVLISTAALADYTPEKKVSGKIKSGGKLVLRLSPTRKLIKEARKRFPKLFIAGFKAEYGIGKDKLIRSARRNLLSNKLNIIVANDLAEGIFNSKETRAFVIDNEGSMQIKKTSKRNAAKAIWDEIDRRL